MMNQHSACLRACEIALIRAFAVSLCSLLASAGCSCSLPPLLLRSLHISIMVREHEEEAPVEEEAEEVEVVDPKTEIEDSCKPRCVKQLVAYEACVKRIEEDEKGQKHCTGQYFDYWGCIDQCAAPKVFRRLA